MISRDLLDELVRVSREREVDRAMPVASVRKKLSNDLPEKSQYVPTHLPMQGLTIITDIVVSIEDLSTLRFVKPEVMRRQERSDDKGKLSCQSLASNGPAAKDCSVAPWRGPVTFGAD